MRALFSKSCAELSLAALVLILLSPFPASAVTAHSQRTFTYIINPVHTDLYFTLSEGGSALDSGAEVEITDTSSYLYSYYDEGDILIRYPSEGNENRNLVGGGYTTNIYIHLVCGQ